MAKKDKDPPPEKPKKSLWSGKPIEPKVQKSFWTGKPIQPAPGHDRKGEKGRHREPPRSFNDPKPKPGEYVPQPKSFWTGKPVQPPPPPPKKVRKSFWTGKPIEPKEPLTPGGQPTRTSWLTGKPVPLKPGEGGTPLTDEDRAYKPRQRATHQSYKLVREHKVAYVNCYCNKTEDHER